MRECTPCPEGFTTAVAGTSNVADCKRGRQLGAMYDLERLRSPEGSCRLQVNRRRLGRPAAPPVVAIYISASDELLTPHPWLPPTRRREHKLRRSRIHPYQAAPRGSAARLATPARSATIRPAAPPHSRQGSACPARPAKRPRIWARRASAPAYQVRRASHIYLNYMELYPVLHRESKPQRFLCMPFRAPPRAFPPLALLSPPCVLAPVTDIQHSSLPRDALPPAASGRKLLGAGAKPAP